MIDCNEIDENCHDCGWKCKKDELIDYPNPTPGTQEFFGHRRNIQLNWNQDLDFGWHDIFRMNKTVYPQKYEVKAARKLYPNDRYLTYKMKYRHFSYNGVDDLPRIFPAQPTFNIHQSWPRV